ncbi:MAG: biliverdin-producing heme oxygenase [Myxococcota bacterium]
MSPSERLRSSTQAVHRKVERTPFVQSFLRGTLALSDYVLHLQALNQVYGELESKVQRHPCLSAFPWRALARGPALRADLRSLGTEAPKEASPATARFLDRLAEAEEDQPSLLVAHAYVRYLGDLSGGQILARIAQSKLGLRESACHFYRFARPVDELKAAFRHALDELSVDIDALVAEALLSFELNEAIFVEIQPKMTRAATAMDTASSPSAQAKGALVL